MSSGRVVGLDVARGLAVLGMFTAHVGDAATDFWSPTGWLQIADGRSAAGFALLAGISAALLSGGRHPRASLTRDRGRIVGRAVTIGVLGLLLMSLGTPIAVILPSYALMFLALTLVLRWSRAALVAAAAVVVVTGPPVLFSARDAGLGGSVRGFLVFGEHYPALVWIAYLLVGLAVGRSDLRSGAVRARLVGIGAACLVLGYGTAVVAGRTLGDGALRELLSAEPHADTTPEVVGNIGFVLLVLVACLVAADRAPRWVLPLAATGALALTAYCVHLVAIFVLGHGVVRDAQNSTLVAFIVVTLVATTAWYTTLGRGPLERGLHLVSSAAGDAVAPQQPVPPREPVPPV